MLVSALLKSSDTDRASCNAHSSFCLSIARPRPAQFWFRPGRGQWLKLPGRLPAPAQPRAIIAKRTICGLRIESADRRCEFNRCAVRNAKFQIRRHGRRFLPTGKKFLRLLSVFRRPNCRQRWCFAGQCHAKRVRSRRVRAQHRAARVQQQRRPCRALQTEYNFRFHSNQPEHRSLPFF